MSKLLKALFLAASLMVVVPLNAAEVISANGKAEISIKANKGDATAARRIARNASEVDAVVRAIKVRLNINPNDPKSKAAIDDMVTQLSDNLKTSYNLEGDVITAKTSLQVESSQIFDLAKSLGLGSKNAVNEAKVLFIIDEYSGIATSLEAGQATETEVEYYADKSSFSDKSAKASGSDASSESSSDSSKSASAYSSKSASAVNASDSVAVKSKEASSLSTKDRVSASAKDRASGSASDSVAYKDGSGSAAAASKRSGAASSDRNYKASSDVNAKQSSEFSGAASSKISAASASQKAGAASAQSASASASSSSSNYSSDVKDVQEQKDITSIKVKSKFPDVNNAKPAEGSDGLISARLEKIAQKFGLKTVPELDFRFEGGRKLLINDIEKLSKVSYYKQKASKGDFKVNYLVFGTAVLNIEKKSPSGNSVCSGKLKVQSSNIDTGGSLFSDTIVATATGISDQVCKDNLSESMATNLAESISTSAVREIQLTATQGSSFDLTLYSVLKVPFKVKKGFTEQLKKLSDEFTEGNSSETSKTFMLQSKGNIKDQVEELMESLREQLPEMKDARMEVKGNRIIVCIEGKCPTE
jgi:hypothetical protein